jgi:hypothetical protein
MPRTLSRSGLFTGAVLLVTAAVVAPAPTAQATLRPEVTFVEPSTPDGATVTDGNAGFTFTVNRLPILIKSLTCTLTPAPPGATTGCATPTRVGLKSKSSKSYTGLPDGDYTFTVTARMKLGGSATATRTFTVDTFTDPVGACFDDTDSTVPDVGIFDIGYYGPINTRGHSDLFPSRDGTCTGVRGSSPTIVRAADGAGANALCQALTGSPGLRSHLRTAGYTTAPADFWECLAL